VVTPLAITIFVWVWVMNAVDLSGRFPAGVVHATGVEHFNSCHHRPNLTFAMSLTVFLIMLGFNVRFKASVDSFTKR